MISAQNLVKRYGDFNTEINMEIPDGRVIGLVGKNGAGKSTTIHMILGLVRPDSGSITVFGKEASSLSAADKEMLGVALSDSGFSNYITVASVIRILKKSYKAFDEAAFRRQCQEMRLPLDKQIKDFSTGMKAKLRVLVAISHKAKLLILDEPTSGLDVEARNDILDILRDYLLEDEHRSIIITSHISSDLEELCDEIYLIHNGKIMLHEDTDVILDNYGILHLNEKQYKEIDKQYLLSSKKKDYEYTCFTQDKRFYMENYPGIVVENGKLDDLILLMTGGRR